MERMISIVLIVAGAAVFPGLIALTKARLNGRIGASVWQPIWDIRRLLRKGSVYAYSTSLIFQLAPTFFLASTLAALLVVPFSLHGGILDFHGDVVFFAYMLALGRFSLIAGAMDVGSGFEGMGANREALYAMLLEPAFFLLMGSLALLTGYDSFSSLLPAMHYEHSTTILVGLLCIYVLVNFTMVENSRLPVDDPKTHLELTMVHEVMILDHSGFDLGLIHIANALKFAAFGALIADIIIPENGPMYLQVPLYLAIQMAFAILVGFMESFRARLRMRKNPLFIVSLSSLALLVFITAVILKVNL